MKNEIIEKLKYFKGVEFHEKQHFYTLNNYRFGISATSLIETYAQEFDSNSISQMVANKRGISQQEVLNEWKKENEFSCIKGSCIHLKAQSLWMKENYEIDYNTINDTIDKNRLKKEYDIMSKQAINFYNDYKDMYDMIQDEFIVWSKEFDIAGSIDGIMYNKYTQQCCILDFKSNKDLQFESKYHKKMKVPLHKLDDVNGQHYYIQLSIYKYLIEKYTNIKVDELFIVYFSINANDYEIINIPYLKEEVEEILENRRKLNMNGMGVLLMGASGSGKSTSLRNLPAEETAIINITNKPMPFRNKDNKKIVCLKDIEAKDYDELYKKIIQAIKGTSKRIVVVDDSSYMMSFENFEKATNKGYDKFTTMAKNYYDLIKSAISCDGEKIVYIITHEEIDDVNQLYRPKTIGKMLSNQLVIEGLFSIVLRSVYKNGEYIFQTQNDGTSVCKSPMDMFEQKEMPNDLFEVDKLIREYYGFKPINEKVESEEK
jgi:hypothetical protein